MMHPFFGLMSLGIVTRRPLVLQLQQIEEGEEEYAEFGHLPRRKFTDFCMFNVSYIGLPLRNSLM